LVVPYVIIEFLYGRSKITELEEGIMQGDDERESFCVEQKMRGGGWAGVHLADSV
jgi:hypothetical protein